MAIELDLSSTPLGVGFSKSYVRIWRAEYRKMNAPGGQNEGPHVLLHVMAYVYKPVDDQQQPIDQKVLFAPWAEILAQPGGDYIAQCYAWLHKQPEFAGGEAV
jgi:hypothetical protein